MAFKFPRPGVSHRTIFAKRHCRGSYNLLVWLRCTKWVSFKASDTWFKSGCARTRMIANSIARPSIRTSSVDVVAVEHRFCRDVLLNKPNCAEWSAD